MINTNLYAVAATYLNRVPTANAVTPSKKTRKVEATSAVYTGGKRFNANAGTKSNFASHIDICI